MVILLRLLKPIALAVVASLVLLNFVAGGRFGVPQVVRDSLAAFVGSASRSPTATLSAGNEPSCGASWRVVSRRGETAAASDCRRFGRTIAAPPGATDDSDRP